MYIEFRLPQGAGGMGALHCSNAIEQELYNWSTLYNIPYKTKIFRYTKRVTFDDDKHYEFFALTWQPKKQQFAEWLEFRFVEPMNIDNIR